MVSALLGLILLVQPADTLGQEPLVLHDSLKLAASETVIGDSYINIDELAHWKYHSGDSLVWAKQEYDDNHWNRISSLSGITDSVFTNVGWVRTKLKIDSSLTNQPQFIYFHAGSGAQLYIDGKMVIEHGTFSTHRDSAQSLITDKVLPQSVSMAFTPGQIITVAVRYSNFSSGFIQHVRSEDYAPVGFSLDLLDMEALKERVKYNTINFRSFGVSAILLVMVMLLHLLMFIRFKEEKGNLWIFLISLSLSIFPFYSLGISSGVITSLIFVELINLFGSAFVLIPISLIPICMSRLVNVDIHWGWKYLIAYSFIPSITQIFGYRMDSTADQVAVSAVLILIVAYGAFSILREARKKNRRYLWLITGTLFSFPILLLLGNVLFGLLQMESEFWGQLLFVMLFTLLPLGFSVYQMQRFFSAHGNLKEEVKHRTEELEQAYNDLKLSMEKLESTQEQLIQQEKLASLGQLTAGIAHEIKNPLNFVNNFSDLSVELVEEAREELRSEKVNGKSEKVEEALEILGDIEANLRKIHEHGSRADGIVKSMLQHSRGGSGKMEPTDLNGVVKEYVNLSFHGMRAGKNPINVDIEMNLDENVGEVPLIAEDFSRVIVNLCNNAFDAMREKLSERVKVKGEKYVPKLTARTKKADDSVIIEVEDNGPGIPEEMKDEIMQPFFTTKKGMEGTGLGLSITNDIVKAHGGKLTCDTESNLGTKMIIQISDS